MIDKSLKQHYDVPETKKIKGQLHKLAYITAKEANLLQKSGGKKVMTPEGIPAYPPQGRSVQHGGQKSTPRDAPQRDHHPPVHTPAPEPDRQDRARQQAAIEQAAAQTKVAEAIINTPSNEELLKTGILQGPELPITTGEGMIPGPIKGVISQPNIPITRDVIPAFVPRKTTTVTGGIPHREDPFQKIVYQPTDLPKRTYDPRTDPNALLQRGSGIGDALKTMGKGALEMALMPFLPKPVRTAWQTKKRYDALQKSALGEKFNLKKLDFSNVESTIEKAKGRQFDTKDPIGWTGEQKRKKTFHEGKGDGQQETTVQEAIAGKTSLGADALGLPELQKRMAMLHQLKQNEDFWNQLTDVQKRNINMAMMNYFKMIDQYSVKSNEGRIRDIG